MQALLPEPESIRIESEPEPNTFKIFIAYDDCSAISRARELQFELARRCRGKVQIHGSSWNFSLLAHPRLREQAAAEAADADMAVISTRGDSDIPGHLQLWIKHWLGCKQRSKAALVALLDPTAPDVGECPRISRTLRRMAENSGIDFFCNLESRLIPMPGELP